MMLLILTSVLGYELKTAVGTSVFIMTFTALTGAASHFYLGGMPDVKILLMCMLSTLFFARVAAGLRKQGIGKDSEPGARYRTDGARCGHYFGEACAVAEHQSISDRASGILK